MRVISAVVLLVAACAAVDAFPSRFIEIVTYNSIGCNNSATASAALVYALDECYTLTASTSARYSIAAAGASSSGLVYTTFTGSVCAGSGTDVPFSSTVSASGTTCLIAGVTSTHYTVPSTRASSVYGITYFSDNACATVSTATIPNPRYSLAGVCGAQSTVQAVFNGNKLQTCSYANAGCTGAADCTDIPNGQCAQTSSGGSYQSAQYSYNASSRAAAASSLAVALLAAAVALVARHL